MGERLYAEAVNAVIRYCFEEVGLDLLICGYFEWNTQSKRVQEKCGFHFYKQRMITTLEDTQELTNENILSNEEWKASHRVQWITV